MSRALNRRSALILTLNFLSTLILTNQLQRKAFLFPTPNSAVMYAALFSLVRFFVLCFGLSYERRGVACYDLCQLLLAA